MARVTPAIARERQHVVVLADACPIRTEPPLHFIGDELFTVLGAKDQMDVVLCIAVGHRCRPSGARGKFISPLTQGLRLWARLCRPSGWYLLDLGHFRCFQSETLQCHLSTP